MTREYSFTLPVANQWYQLWRDMIFPSFVDPTFGNTPYTPSVVSSLDIQNQTTAAVLQVSDLSLSAGRQITTGNSYNKSMNDNIINLKVVTVKSSVANTVIHVSIDSN